MIPKGTFDCVVAIGVLALAVLAGSSGCRSSGRDQEVDNVVRRNAEAARRAFDEGDDLEAIDRYRLAVRRAWLLDDPSEIGTNAYNLAASLAAVGRYAEARDWLREARAELARADRDINSVLILEAKVARQQGAFYEAVAIADSVDRAIHMAEHERGSSACRIHGSSTSHIITASHVYHDDREKRERKRSKGLCRSEKREKEREKRENRAAADAQIHLFWASLAMDQDDFDRAAAEIETARQALLRVPPGAVQAEWERVMGRFLLIQGRPFEAAVRFDTESQLLRFAEVYREIPAAYEAAAQAYEMAGAFDLAADRFMRVARILYALRELTAALQFVDYALPLAEVSGDVDLQGRLLVVFNEAARDVEAAKKRDRSAEEEPESTEDNSPTNGQSQESQRAEELPRDPVEVGPTLPSPVRPNGSTKPMSSRSPSRRSPRLPRLPAPTSAGPVISSH